MDTSSAEFKAALRDHAKSLGVDPDAEPHLLALVEEALLADIPEGWEQGETDDGTLYYFNAETEESIWEHPLDAHYRTLITDKKRERAERSSTTTVASTTTAVAAAPATAATTTATTPISSIEVYSFDDDSDDDVVPVAKAGAATENDKSSRIASLFPQPMPSFSATAAAMATETNKHKYDTSSANTTLSSSAGAASRPASAAAAASPSSGFGRDRSWLLDADEDDDDSGVAIPTLSQSSSSSAGGNSVTTAPTAAVTAVAVPISTLQASRVNSYGGRDDDAFSSSRPPFASSLATSVHASATPPPLSFSTRMYGSSSTSSTTSLSASGLGSSGSAAAMLASPSGAPSSALLMDIGSSPITSATASSSDTSPAQSKTGSPRRGGLGSSVKNQFFQDMSVGAAATGPSTTHGSSSNVSLPADVAKIQQLEKRVSELSKQNEQLVAERESTRLQLEHAQLEAKESSYLKMKASESKAKLADKDAECAKAAVDHVAAVAKLQRELEHVRAERDRLTTQQQQHATSSSREALELQTSAAAAIADKTAMQRKLSELEQQLVAAQQDAARHQRGSDDATATLERERSAHASAITILHAGLEQQRKDHDAELQQLRTQLDAARRDASDKERRTESVGVLQDTLERQTKFVKELEERNKELHSRVVGAEEREAAARRDAVEREAAVRRDAVEREAAVRRDATERERGSADAAKKAAAMRTELDAKDAQLKALDDKLRAQLETTAALETRAAAWWQLEDDWNRERAGVERERRARTSELQDRSDEIQRLQTQLRRQSDEHARAVSTLEVALQDAQRELQTVKQHELQHLTKQIEQLRRELERANERIAALDAERRQHQQALADAASTLEQRALEVEAWKRKEKQQRAQRESLANDKAAVETRAAALAVEHAQLETTARREVETLTARLRALESATAQKDYEVQRANERCEAAEVWRVKEARRVETRDAQLLAAKDALAQLERRNVEAETSAEVLALRREREQLQLRIAQTAQQLEEEKRARLASSQQSDAELETMRKALAWQLPQLAAACVSRASDAWVRKCRAAVKAQRDELQLEALAARNELMRAVERAETARTHVEQKLATAVAESDFLRKEVHRVEDNNKVLLDQLHTVRVYLTQRSVAPSMMAAPMWGTSANHSTGIGSGFSHPRGSAPPASSSTMFGSSGAAAPMPPPPHSAASGVPFNDYSTVNHLNAQLGVLHAQFQQLFDATERRPTGFAIPTPYVRQQQFSPSERFEIPTSPLARTTAPHATDLDQTVDVLLDETLESCSSSAANRNKAKEREQEQLISTLEALAVAPATAASVRLDCDDTPQRAVSLVADASLVVGGESSLWYQKDYWRNKYQ